MVEKTAQEKKLEGLNVETLTEMTAQIAASYVGNHNVPVSELPALMSTIYQSMSKLGGHVKGPEARPEPAVAVKKSVTPEYIICLEDGKKLKMLKRHLKTAYKMTPEQYKERWNLPADYPLVAPNYAKQRSKLAKQIGLGTSRRTGSSKKAA